MFILKKKKKYYKQFKALFIFRGLQRLGKRIGGEDEIKTSTLPFNYSTTPNNKIYLLFLNFLFILKYDNK